MATFPTVPDIKEFQRNEKATEDDEFYSDALDAAKQTINDECQREFVVAGDAAARTFVPDRYSDVLRVGDFTTVTSVVENGVTLTLGTHYQREPINTVNAAGLTVPYNSLRRLDACWYHYGPRGTVVVTATWGFLTIPVRIVEAVKIITKDIISNRDVQLGLVAVTDVAGIVARTNPVVRATIDKYRSEKSYGLA